MWATPLAEGRTRSSSRSRASRRGRGGRRLSMRPDDLPRVEERYFRQGFQNEINIVATTSSQLRVILNGVKRPQSSLTRDGFPSRWTPVYQSFPTSIER